MATPIVRCGSCGQLNRLRAGVEGTNHFCGKCRTPLQAVQTATLTRAQRSWRDVRTVLLLALAAAYGWAAWPVSAWLGLCLFGSWLVGRWAQSWFPPALDGPKSILRPALRLAMLNVARALVYVGIGIGIVGLAQIGLAFAGHVSPDLLWEVEQSLSDLRSRLNSVLGFENLLIALGALVAVAMLFPRSHLMDRMIRARSLLGRAYLLLLGLTSFTFFSGLNVERREEPLQLKARYEARRGLGDVEQIKRDIAGAAWVTETVLQLPNKERTAAANYFRVASRGLSPTADVAALAQRLAGAAPSLTPEASTVRGAGQVHAGETIISAHMEAHIRSNWPITHDAPPLRLVEKAAADLQAQRARLSAVRKAAIEVASEGLATVVGSGHRPLAQAFIEEIVSSLSRGSLRRVVPDVNSLELAKAWAQAHVTPQVAIETASREAKWVWEVTHFEPRLKVAPVPIPGTRPFGLTPHTVPMPYRTYPPPHVPYTPPRTSGFRFHR